MSRSEAAADLTKCCLSYGVTETLLIRCITYTIDQTIQPLVDQYHNQENQYSLSIVYSHVSRAHYAAAQEALRYCISPDNGPHEADGMFV